MSKILGPQFGYVDLLDYGTYENSKNTEAAIKDGTSRPHVLRPSSAGKCERELAYGIMEQTGQAYYEKEVREPNVSRLLSVGHAIEEDFIAHFNMATKDYFKVRYNQQSVMGFDITSKKYPELLAGPIEGSIDSVFLSEDGKGLIDYKSKKNKFHSYFRSDWDATTSKLHSMDTVVSINDSDQAFWVEDIEAFIVELNDPFFESNFWQLNFYCNTAWALRKGIDHAAIIQYCKNDSMIREIRFKPSAALYERTRLKFQSAADAADKGDPRSAKRSYNLSSIKCAFCPYSKDCWKEKGDVDAKQEFFDANFPKKKWPKELKKLDKAVIPKLELAYEIVKEKAATDEAYKKASGEIVEFMLDHGFKKMKFADGSVYETKYLKTGRPNWQLRRSKA